MPECSSCGRHLMRAHRGTIQKLLYMDVFRCTKCGNRLKRMHPVLRSNVQFCCSRYTRCIRCGTFDVHRLSKRDRVDTMSRHPASWFFRLLGAPLAKCTACRLQYYDWRPFKPGARSV